MFSPAPDPPFASPSSWRDALRNAVDLTMAFTTLESYSVDDLWPPRRRTGAPPLDFPRAAPAADWPAASSAAGRRRQGPVARRPGGARTPAQHCSSPRRAGAAATAAARAIAATPPRDQHARAPTA